MDFNISEDEMERKRYAMIKKSGQYMELNILISANQEKFDGHIGKLPVVNTTMCRCGSEEIANMYVILKHLINYYEKEYPTECTMAESMMDCRDMGVITTPIVDEEE